MSRAAILLAIVLLLAAFAPAAAQRQDRPDGDSAAAPPTQPSRPRTPRAFTGLAISFAVRVDAGGAETQAYPVVRAVEPGSPGQQAGIMAGDMITEVNGQDSRERGALWLQPNVRYTLRIRTGEQEREVLLTPLPPRDPPPPPAP